MFFGGKLLLKELQFCNEAYGNNKDKLMLNNKNNKEMRWEI